MKRAADVHRISRVPTFGSPGRRGEREWGTKKVFKEIMS